MEVEAVTHTIQWLASQRDAQITHANVLTDSMNLPQKAQSGMGCLAVHTAMHSLWLQRLASTADVTSGLQLGRAEVLQA